MRQWILVACLIACGPPVRGSDSTLVIDDKPATPADATPATVAKSGTPAKSPSITAQLTVEEACARFETLAAAGCDWTQRFPPEFRQGSSCVKSLTTWVADPKLQKSVSCWSLECEPAAQCMVATHSEGPKAPTRNCGEDGTGPVIVDASTWAARNGADVKKFADAKSSEKEPIEVCGIESEVEWITRVKCNDGSNPYGTPAKANESRDSWVAKGGRCGSILDRYSVKCPEKTYQVFVDRYICPRT
jgi:hypothetical protein